MTMPVKIWVTEPNDKTPMEAYLGAGSWDTRTPYIRADLAEELARALVHAMEWVDSEATRIKMQKVMDAYATITT